jgi:hypothetical protein
MHASRWLILLKVRRGLNISSVFRTMYDGMAARHGGCRNIYVGISILVANNTKVTTFDMFSDSHADLCGLLNWVEELLQILEIRIRVSGRSEANSLLSFGDVSVEVLRAIKELLVNVWAVIHVVMGIYLTHRNLSHLGLVRPEMFSSAL